MDDRHSLVGPFFISRMGCDYFFEKIESMNLFFLSSLLLLAIVIATVHFSKKNKGARALITFFLIAGSGLGYWHWGAWRAYVLFQHQQAALKSFKNPEELIDKMKQHLQADPHSAQGFYLLGRLYVSLERWGDARPVFKKAHDLAPKNESITVNYAISLWEINHQRGNAEIRTLFEALLMHNPNQPDALSMLAMDAFHEHAYAKAIDYWTRLLALVPLDSPEAKALHQAILKVQRANSRAASLAK